MMIFVNRVIAGTPDLNADLAPVPQELIGKHDGNHRFSDRNGADANARIVSPLRDDLGFMALPIDGPTWRQD